MPPIIKENADTFARWTFYLAVIGLGYKGYSDLGVKMDMIIQTSQHLTDHENSDNTTHTIMYQQIAEVREKIETSIRPNNKR